MNALVISSKHLPRGTGGCYMHPRQNNEFKLAIALIKNGDCEVGKRLLPGHAWDLIWTECAVSSPHLYKAHCSSISDISPHLRSRLCNTTRILVLLAICFMTFSILLYGVAY